jgi:hypothetical protein
MSRAITYRWFQTSYMSLARKPRDFSGCGRAAWSRGNGSPESPSGAQRSWCSSPRPPSVSPSPQGGGDGRGEGKTINSFSPFAATPLSLFAAFTPPNSMGVNTSKNDHASISGPKCDPACTAGGIPSAGRGGRRVRASCVRRGRGRKAVPTVAASVNQTTVDLQPFVRPPRAVPGYPGIDGRNGISRLRLPS